MNRLRNAAEGSSATPTIVLYGRPFNRTDRVQWTLEELGLSYEYRKLDVFALEHRQPEFRAKYGLTRLPFVEIDGRVLFESGAIMIVLAQGSRHRARLLPPEHTSEYAEVLQWLFFANSTLDAAREEMPSGADPAPFAPAIDALSFVDAALRGKDVVAGSEFSLADIALCNNLKYFDEKLRREFPDLERYRGLHTQRPAYRRIVEQEEYPVNRG